MAAKFRIKAVLAELDIPALTDLARHLVASGHTREEAIDDIVALVDATIPWATILPGPAGAVIEAVDGPIARGIARLIVAGAAKRT